MRIADLPLSDPRALLAEERDDLVSLLGDLSDDEWLASTEAGHWRVKDVALHLLDDDLGWLSRERDGDPSGLLPTTGDYRSFVRSLDEQNERWVAGTGGLSCRVVTELLRWSGDQLHLYFKSLDLTGPSRVIWAERDDVPRWFDLCRDLTERWVHQRQIRNALNQPGDHDRFLPTVLRTFVWAFPHQYRIDAPLRTIVQVDLGIGGTWTLTRSAERWELDEGVAEEPEAVLVMPEAVAWRQLTGLPVRFDDLSMSGNEKLLRPLLEVRSIIA